MTTPPTTENCPRCGAQIPDAGEWTFCASCGSPLAGAQCPRCDSPLTPGAQFCHRCGLPTGGRPSPDPVAPAKSRQTAADRLPWAVGAIALLALAAMVAGRGLTADRDRAPDSPAFSAGPPARAADISQLSPEERADRLYNRVMLLASQNKRDSVAFFAPMAIQAYGMLGPLNDDQHYDVGRVAEAAGALPLAQAHADSILARSPNHLLGLALAASVADAQRNTTARAAYDRRLLAAHEAELRRALPEYERHADEIRVAVDAARSGAGGAR